MQKYIITIKNNIWNVYNRFFYILIIQYDK